MSQCQEEPINMEMEECITEESAPPKRKRRKVADPDSWKMNKRRKMRNSGQEYLSCRGKIMAGRHVSPKDCSKCKKKCNESFSEEDREKIHKAFWGLCDSEKQKLFISTMVEEGPKATTRTKSEQSRRTVTRHYYLRLGKRKRPVCLGFFRATLDISESVIKNILKNRDETSYFPRESQRGCAPSKRARPEEVREAIREHIRSCIQLQPVEPGTAKKRKKGVVADATQVEQVAEAGLNITRMWSAYVAQCQWNGTTPEKLWLYREIVTKEFNIKFVDPCSKRAPHLVLQQVAAEEVVIQPAACPDPLDTSNTLPTTYYIHY